MVESPLNIIYIHLKYTLQGGLRVLVVFKSQYIEGSFAECIGLFCGICRAFWGDIEGSFAVHIGLNVEGSFAEYTPYVHLRRENRV